MTAAARFAQATTEGLTQQQPAARAAPAPRGSRSAP